MFSLRNASVAVLALLLMLASCVHEFDEQQFTSALKRIDDWTAAVNEAVEKIAKQSDRWRDESARWRDSLETLEQRLRADAQDILANEIKNIGSSFTADVGDQGKATIDYLEVKLKSNLQALRAALEAARKEVLASKEKKDAGGIKRALDKIAEFKIFHDPVVTGFIPSKVEVRWRSHLEAEGYEIRVPLIEVRGWGFDRPNGEVSRLSIAVVDQSGATRALPTNVIFKTTRYLMQINLGAPGVAFDRKSHGIVLRVGSADADTLTLPVVHTIPQPPAPPPPPPPPPPPAPDKVIRVTVVYTDVYLDGSVGKDKWSTWLTVNGEVHQVWDKKGDISDDGTRAHGRGPGGDQNCTRYTVNFQSPRVTVRPDADLTIEFHGTAHDDDDQVARSKLTFVAGQNWGIGQGDHVCEGKKCHRMGERSGGDTEYYVYFCIEEVQ